jgi:Family of unknown function (DUF6279)
LSRPVFFILVCLLVGCSVVSLGYRNGEFLSYWWLNGYVDFNAEQQPLVKKKIANLFAWHHKTQLKDYVEILTLAQKRIQHNVTQAELLTDYGNLKKRLVRVVDQVLPDLADVALSLQPAQIAHIKKKFASNNDFYHKDHLKGEMEARQKFRYQKLMQHAKYWFGDFSREQEALIRVASDARPLNNELVFAEHVRRQNELIALLKKIQAEKPDKATAVALLRQYVNAYLDYFGDPASQVFFDTGNKETAHVAMVIINLTTPQQKAHAVERAQKWIGEFNALAL